MCSLHDLNKYSLSKLCLKKMIDDNDRNDVNTAGIISDFLDMRKSDPSDTGLTDIINFLCTCGAHGVVVKASDLRSRGHGFDSRAGHV